MRQPPPDPGRYASGSGTWVLDIAIALCVVAIIGASVMFVLELTGQLPERQRVEVCTIEGNTTICHKETRTIKK